MSGSHKDYYIDVWEDLYGEAYDHAFNEGKSEDECHAIASKYADAHAMDEADDRMADMADYYMDMALGK